MDASQHSDWRTLSSPIIVVPVGPSWRPKGERQRYGELARAELRLILSACSFDVGMNDRVSSGTEEAHRADKVGGHGAEGDHDPERVGDTPANVLGRTWDIDGYGSRDTADARDGDEVTGVNEPEALRDPAADGRQDPAEGRSIRRRNTRACGKWCWRGQECTALMTKADVYLASVQGRQTRAEAGAEESAPQKALFWSTETMLDGITFDLFVSCVPDDLSMWT
jgi:hypothetical protein